MRFGCTRKEIENCNHSYLKVEKLPPIRNQPRKQFTHVKETFELQRPVMRHHGIPGAQPSAHIPVEGGIIPMVFSIGTPAASCSTCAGIYVEVVTTAPPGMFSPCSPIRAPDSVEKKMKETKP